MYVCILCIPISMHIYFLQLLSKTAQLTTYEGDTTHLLRTKNITLCKSKEKGICDLTSSTSNAHTDGSFLYKIGGHEKVACSERRDTHIYTHIHTYIQIHTYTPYTCMHTSMSYMHYIFTPHHIQQPC